MMAGNGIPTPLDVKPLVRPADYDWYVRTFNRLQVFRQTSEVYSHIMMTEYVAYFSVFEPLDSIKEDITVLMEFDRVYVEIKNEKLAQKRQVKQKV